jgi:hypothetical protein
MATKKQQKKKGLLGNIVSGVTQGARERVLAPIDMLLQSVTDPEMKQLLWSTDVSKSTKGLSSKDIQGQASKMASTYGKYGIDEGRAGQLLTESIPEALLKSSAALGSYFVPGGKTLGGAIGLGAASGALQGLGTSGRGEEFSGILGGGIGGAAGGGIGYGASQALGKGLQKLGGEKGLAKGTGEFLEEAGTRNIGKSKGIKLDPKAADPYLDALQRTIQGEDIAKGAGQKFNIKGLSKTRQGILQSVSGLLEGNTQTVGTVDEVVDSLMDVAPGAFGWVQEGSEDKTRSYLTSVLRKSLKNKGATTLTAQDLAGAIRNLDDLAFKNKFTPSNPTIAADLLYNELRPRLGAAVPEINPLYQQLSELYNILPDMAKFSEKGGTPLNLFGNKVPLTGGVGPSIQNIFGQAERGVGQMLQGGLPTEALGQAIAQPAVSSALGRAGGLVGPSMLGGAEEQPAIAGQMQSELPAPAPAVTQSKEGQDAILSMVNQMKAQGMNPNEVANAMLSQGVNPELVESVLIQAGAPKLSDQPLKDIVGSQQGMGTGFGFGQDVQQKLAMISMLGNAGVPAEMLYPLLIETLMPSSGSQGQNAYSQLASMGIKVPGKTETERESTAQQLLGRFGSAEEMLQSAPIQYLTDDTKKLGVMDENSATLQKISDLSSYIEQPGKQTGVIASRLGFLRNEQQMKAQAIAGDIGNEIIRRLSGAAVSAAEEARVRKNVPTAMDTEKELESKLAIMQTFMERDNYVKEQAIRRDMSEMEFYQRYKQEIEKAFPIL